MSADVAVAGSPRRRVSVFRAVLLIGLAVLFLNAAVVTILVVNRAERAVDEAAVRDLQADSVLVREVLRNVPKQQTADVVRRLAQELGVRFTLVAADGTVVADSFGDAKARNESRRPEVAEALAGRVGTSIRLSPTVGRTLMYVAIPAAGEPYVVRTSRDYAAIQAQSAAVRNATLMVTIGSSMGALALFLVFARRLDARINLQIEAWEIVERQRLRAEQMFRDFVETTTDWVWAVDESFTVTYSNPAVKDILGYAPEEMVGQPLHARLVHPTDLQLLARELPALTAGGHGWRDLVLRWRHKNGSMRYLESDAVPIRGADGSLEGYRGADRDVTERREAERMKSDFVSFVSHQLRTPIAGMKWMMELAGGVKDLPADAREYIGESQASADRLSRLVTDLLDIARIESGRFVLSQEDVVLDQVTRDVMTEFEGVAREKGVAIASELQGPAVIRADGQMMRQVVTNLLSNAVKYTPRGGRIDVALDVRNGLARWSVHDTGVGIPKNAQSRLFEKFFRADNAIAIETEGSGLGLHLVRLILEHSGGRIWCDSEEGQGATFTFTVPTRETTA